MEALKFHEWHTIEKGSKISSHWKVSPFQLGKMNNGSVNLFILSSTSTSLIGLKICFHCSLTRFFLEELEQEVEKNWKLGQWWTHVLDTVLPAWT